MFKTIPISEPPVDVGAAIAAHGRLRQVERELDPFLLDNGCVVPQGHQTIVSCGEVACRHCSKIFWE